MIRRYGKQAAVILAVVLAWPLAAGACGGGMGMGGSGGMGGTMGGSGGMMGMAPAVAADGSIVLIEGTQAGMWGWNQGEQAGSIAVVDPSGVERWRVTFTDLVPMMVTTEQNLVLATLSSGTWNDDDQHGGDHGWGGMGGMMGGSGMGGSSVLLALDLATGAELWRLDLEASMLMAQISPDGSLIYSVATQMGGGMGGGSMHQGDASQGWSSTLYAIDALTGAVVWTRELSNGGFMY